MIGEGPAVVERRQQLGHWEIDTMMGQSSERAATCIVPPGGTQKRYMAIGKLAVRTAEATPD
jgi:IS30 family transposase